ncbi:YdcF family protein [Companilactobacillus nuruki]|uniref:DUF218 domain-containing protein n=1 Tax=Companilactobacillus nuruki TaxID=1993540 RepID=A0A2N7ASW9_9LACO|nr:YdcF family protein [Companilactobacillus nuruki]PMD68776.1 hypothetical protein CBP76_08725 [Companilactobacillus nuruki]
MNFLLMAISTVIELLMIFKTRYVYSRHPIFAIVLSILTILGFPLLSLIVSNWIIRAYIFNFGVVNLLFLIIMLIYMYQIGYYLKKIKPVNKPDFLVVLGNKCIGHRVTPILMERLDESVKIYQSLDVKPVVIVSCGRGKNGQTAESILMKEYLLGQGIPENMIVVENKSINTIQNLEFSSIKIHDLWKKDRFPRVIIVTSDYHIPRAKLHARRLGLKVRFAAASTIKMLKWPAMFREFTAIIWYHRYTVYSILGIAILFSISMCM